MTEGLREKIQSICSNLCTASKPHECVTCNGVVDAILEAVVAEIPKIRAIDPNAEDDSYFLGVDVGWNSFRDAMIKRLGRKEA